MFSSFLKEYRKENGMTQTDLAKELGLSQNAISQYESGKRCPSINKLAGIAKKLGHDVKEIVAE